MRLNRWCYLFFSVQKLLLGTEIKWMLGRNSAVTLNTKKQEMSYGMVRIEENSLKGVQSCYCCQAYTYVVSLSITQLDI